MFIRRALALVLAMLWLWPAVAQGQSPELNAAYIRFADLYAKGRYVEALPFAEKALRLGEQEFGPDHPATATLLDGLAVLYDVQGRYADAEPLYKRAVLIREKTLGPNHLRVAISLDNLARLYRTQGRHAEAEPLYERSLAIYEKALGPEHPNVAASLNNLAGFYDAQGRYAEAEPLYERSLAIYKKALGPLHPNVDASLNNLAKLYRAQGRHAEAEPLLKRVLVIRETALGPEHPGVAQSLNSLAELYRHQGRPAEAEPLYERSLAIYEKALGPEHPNVAASLNNLAGFYDAQGRYADSEPLYERSLAIYEKALGPEHPDVATSIDSLAGLYDTQGRYDDAEQLYERSLAIREKALGPEHPGVARSLNALAELYRGQGRYADSEPLYERSLAIYEKALGPEHPSVALSLNNLGVLHRDEGRYAEAEPLYKRSLLIREKALGPENPGVAESLNSLAALYDLQGRYSDAEPLHKRALAIWEKVLGLENPSVALSLNNLAALYHAQDRYADAEPLLKRALAIYEKVLGPEHPSVAPSLNNLAALYHAQGRYADAEPHLKRTLAIDEKTLGPEHPHVATSLNNLAELYLAQGHYAEAEPLYKRALAILEKAVGPEHPDVATSLNNFAGLYNAQGRYAEALDHVRRATNIHRERANRTSATRSTGAREEQASKRHLFLAHAHIAASIIERDTTQRPLLLAESFEVGQLAKATSAAAAVARMSARFAAGSDDLARVVRDRQDAVERWQRIDARLMKEASEPPEKRDAGMETRLRNELSALDEHIDALDATLAGEFPTYAELASPRPVSLNDVQSLLGPAEALVTFAVWNNSTFLWVVRHGGASFQELDIGYQQIEDAVTALRGGLDQTPRSLGDVRPFDTEEAFLLYDAIFAPAEPLLEGARHVFVVPDAALQSLPVGVLVTKEPEHRVRKLEDYAEVPWLAKKYAMTVLPSVSSLRALRRFAKIARAEYPFVGFGDPLLEGDPGRGRGFDVAALFTRGVVADVDSVLKLPRLPDTADELQALAQSLGAEDDTVFLGERATETLVRSEDLSSYRVLAFATHGLVAGDLKGVAEPALVFTPPETGSEADDGLLTASEIATLNLDADWVILSACNTAAADGTPGAEGLSGLAKAFFYAGARALLVSHWSVASDATVRLTTTMLDEMRADRGIGRAEALRRARLKLMTDEEKPYFAHPMFWAPFVVVGEGGVPQG